MVIHRHPTTNGTENCLSDSTWGGGQAQFQARCTLMSMQKIPPWFIGLGDMVIDQFLERDQRSCSLWRHDCLYLCFYGCFLEAVPAKMTPCTWAGLCCGLKPCQNPAALPDPAGTSGDLTLPPPFLPLRCRPGSCLTQGKLHLERKQGKKIDTGGEGIKSLPVSKNGPLKPSQVTAATSPVLKDVVNCHFWKHSPDYLSGKSHVWSVGP